MSLTGSSNSESRRLEDVQRIVDAGFAGDHNGGVDYVLGNLASAIGMTLRAIEDNEVQQGYLTDIIHYLNKIRRPVFQPGHCEECDDANIMIEAVTKSLDQVDIVAAARGLATILKILIDSTRDSDLAQDIYEEIDEALSPDETETVHVH